MKKISGPGRHGCGAGFQPALARRGFTLVEMLVSMMVIGITGGVLFSGIRTVALLGAKNGAINVTHQQSRETIHRAVHQLHSAVSIPSLAATSLAPMAGNGPTAAVTFQTLVGGPYKVFSSAAAGDSVVRVTYRAGDPAPEAGMRLIVPAFPVEADITAAVALGSSYSLTLATPLAAAIDISGTPLPEYVAYITQRSALAVIGGELRHYQRISAGTYAVVATNVTTPTPFTVPGGNNRFIRADFAVRDPRITGLNLKMMDTMLSLTVPYRCQLATIQ